MLRICALTLCLTVWMWRPAPLPADASPSHFQFVSNRSPRQLAQASVDLGTISGRSTRRVYKIAVTEATMLPGAKKRLRAGTVRDVIENDLLLSGTFDPLGEHARIQAVDAKDRQRSAIHYDDWRGLGASFVVKIAYQMDDKTIVAEAELLETTKGVRVFARRYSRQSLSNWRTIAHAISDDIYEHINFKKGVANTKMVFVREIRRGFKEIYVMDADGANQRQLTNDNSLAVAPCWGRNGTEIYYTSYKDFNPDLCGVYLRGGQPWYVSRQPGLNLSADWNGPTGRIILSLNKDGNSEIYSMDAKGGNLRRLTRDRGIDTEPSFYPNGKRALFTSSRGSRGGAQVWTMDIDGLNPKRLTFQGRDNRSASMSPTGDRIVFCSRQKGVYNIFTMDVDGKNWRQLTGTNGHEGSNESPSWAPNGELIVFTSDRTGSTQIYLMTADGLSVHKLTNSGKNETPAWSPFM